MPMALRPCVMSLSILWLTNCLCCSVLLAAARARYSECSIACLICMRKCPTNGIIGGKNRIHVIDQEKCTSCGTCFDVCPDKFDAVVKCSGEPVPAPIPEEMRTIDRKKKK